MDDEKLTEDAIGRFCAALAASGLVAIPTRWGITKSALLRGAGRAVREIRSADGDSRLALYQPPGEGPVWSVLRCGPDDREGTARWTEDYALGSPALAERAAAIEAWLAANPDAYDYFAPFRWSAAPERARETLARLEAEWGRLSASPLAALFADLRAELLAAGGPASS